MEVGAFLELAFDRGPAFLHLPSEKTAALSAHDAAVERRAAQAEAERLRLAEEADAIMSAAIVEPTVLQRHHSSNSSSALPSPSFDGVTAARAAAAQLGVAPAGGGAAAAAASSSHASLAAASSPAFPSLSDSGMGLASSASVTALEVVGEELLAKLQYYSSRGPRWAQYSLAPPAATVSAIAPPEPVAPATGVPSSFVRGRHAAGAGTGAAAARPTSAQQLLQWGGVMGGVARHLGSGGPGSILASLGGGGGDDSAKDYPDAQDHGAEEHRHGVARRALQKRLRRAEELDRRKMQHASRIAEFQASRARRDRDAEGASRGSSDASGRSLVLSPSAAELAAAAAAAALASAAAAPAPEAPPLSLEEQAHLEAENLDFRRTFGVHFALFPFEKSLLQDRLLAFRLVQARAKTALQARLLAEHEGRVRRDMVAEQKAAAIAEVARAAAERGDDPAEEQPLPVYDELDEAEVARRTRETFPPLETHLVALPVPLSLVAPAAAAATGGAAASAASAADGAGVAEGSNGSAAAAASSGVSPLADDPSPAATSAAASASAAAAAAASVASALLPAKSLQSMSCQGDPGLQDVASKTARSALRQNPRVLRMLDQFWTTFSERDSKHGLVKREYVEVHARMHRALLRDQGNNAAWVAAGREREEQRAARALKARRQSASANAMAGAIAAAAAGEGAPNAATAAAAAGAAGVAPSPRVGSASSSARPVLDRQASRSVRPTMDAAASAAAAVAATAPSQAQSSAGATGADASSVPTASTAAGPAVPTIPGVNLTPTPLVSIPSLLRPEAALPRSSFHVDEAELLALKDWVRDTHRSSGNANGLKYHSFLDSMFELVDLWTETTDPNEYCEFLSVLFQRITKQSPPTVAPGNEGEGSQQCRRKKKKHRASSDSGGTSYARWRPLREIPFEGWGVEDIWARFVEREKAREAARIRALLAARAASARGEAAAALAAKQLAAKLGRIRGPRGPNAGVGEETITEDEGEGDYFDADALDEYANAAAAAAAAATACYSDEEPSLPSSRGGGGAGARSGSGRHKRTSVDLANRRRSSGGSLLARAMTLANSKSSSSIGADSVRSEKEKDAAARRKRKNKRRSTHKVERLKRKAGRRASHTAPKSILAALEASESAAAAHAAAEAARAGLRSITVLDRLTGEKHLAQVSAREIAPPKEAAPFPALGALYPAAAAAAAAADDDDTTFGDIFAEESDHANGGAAATGADGSGSGGAIPEGDERYELVPLYEVDHVDSATGEPVYTKRMRRVLVELDETGAPLLAAATRRKDAKSPRRSQSKSKRDSLAETEAPRYDAMGNMVLRSKSSLPPSAGASPSSSKPGSPALARSGTVTSRRLQMFTAAANAAEASKRDSATAAFIIPPGSAAAETAAEATDASATSRAGASTLASRLIASEKGSASGPVSATTSRRGSVTESGRGKSHRRTASPAAGELARMLLRRGPERLQRRHSAKRTAAEAAEAAEKAARKAARAAAHHDALVQEAQAAADARHNVVMPDLSAFMRQSTFITQEELMAAEAEDGSSGGDGGAVGAAAAKAKVESEAHEHNEDLFPAPVEERPPPPVLDASALPYRRLVAESRSDWLARLVRDKGYNAAMGTVESRSKVAKRKVKAGAKAAAKESESHAKSGSESESESEEEEEELTLLEFDPNDPKWARDVERAMWFEMRGLDESEFDLALALTSHAHLHVHRHGHHAHLQGSGSKASVASSNGSQQGPGWDPDFEHGDEDGPSSSTVPERSGGNLGRKNSTFILSPRVPTDRRLRAQLQAMGLGAAMVPANEVGDDGDEQGWDYDPEEEARLQAEKERARKAARREHRRAERLRRAEEDASRAEEDARAAEEDAQAGEMLWGHVAREVALKQWRKDQLHLRAQRSRSASVGAAAGSAAAAAAAAAAAEAEAEPRVFELAPLAQRIVEGRLATAAATAAAMAVTGHRPSVAASRRSNPVLRAHTSAQDSAPTDTEEPAPPSNKDHALRESLLLNPELLLAPAEAYKHAVKPGDQAKHRFASPNTPFRKYSMMITSGRSPAASASASGPGSSPGHGHGRSFSLSSPSPRRGQAGQPGAGADAPADPLAALALFQKQLAAKAAGGSARKGFTPMPGERAIAERGGDDDDESDSESDSDSGSSDSDSDDDSDTDSDNDGSDSESSDYSGDDDDDDDNNHSGTQGGDPSSPSAWRPASQPQSQGPVPPHSRHSRARSVSVSVSQHHHPLDPPQRQFDRESHALHWSHPPGLADAEAAQAEAAWTRERAKEAAVIHHATMHLGQTNSQGQGESATALAQRQRLRQASLAAATRRKDSLSPQHRPPMSDSGHNIVFDATAAGSRSTSRRNSVSPPQRLSPSKRTGGAGSSPGRLAPAQQSSLALVAGIGGGSTGSERSGSLSRGHAPLSQDGAAATQSGDGASLAIQGSSSTTDLSSRRASASVSAQAHAQVHAQARARARAAKAPKSKAARSLDWSGMDASLGAIVTAASLAPLPVPVADPQRAQEILDADAAEEEWARLMEQRHRVQMEAAQARSKARQARADADAKTALLRMLHGAAKDGDAQLSDHTSDTSESDSDGDSDQSDSNELSSDSGNALPLTAVPAAKAQPSLREHSQRQPRSRFPAVPRAQIALVESASPVRVGVAAGPDAAGQPLSHRQRQRQLHAAGGPAAVSIRFPSIGGAGATPAGMPQSGRGWSHQLSLGLVSGKAAAESKEAEGGRAGAQSQVEQDEETGGWKDDSNTASSSPISSRRGSLPRPISFPSGGPHSSGAAASTASPRIEPKEHEARLRLSRVDSAALLAREAALEARSQAARRDRHARAASVADAGAAAAAGTGTGTGVRAPPPVSKALFRTTWDIVGSAGPGRDWIGRSFERGAQSAREHQPSGTGTGARAVAAAAGSATARSRASNIVPIRPLSLDPSGSSPSGGATTADLDETVLLGRMRKLARISALKRSKLLSTAYHALPPQHQHQQTYEQYEAEDSAAAGTTSARTQRARRRRSRSPNRCASPPRIVPAAAAAASPRSYPFVVESSATTHTAAAPLYSRAQGGVGASTTMSALATAALGCSARAALGGGSSGPGGALVDPLRSPRFKRFIAGMARLVEQRETVAAQRRALEDTFKVGPHTAADAVGPPTMAPSHAAAPPRAHAAHAPALTLTELMAQTRAARAHM